MRQVERRRVVELGEELGPPIAHVLEADHRRTVEQESVVPGIGNIPGPLPLAVDIAVVGPFAVVRQLVPRDARMRSEEHTSELQSLMRISYAVFCLKKNRVY